MEIAVKETYAHLVKDESLVQNSNKLYIVEFHFDQSWDGYAKSAIFVNRRRTAAACGVDR